jgi:putative DNA primase/helicase
LFFARDLIDGDMPLHLIEKPEVGTGAGKLADCCMIPALGGRQAVITDCNDEDEWRKRIFATLLSAPEAVLLDNVVKITSHHLAALFTAKRFRDRMLGISRMVELAVDMPWVATGCNPEIGYDLVRRICAIRLNAKMPDPTTRTGFRHALPEWAIENRASLVWAALTLVQHWVAQGQPAWKGQPVASFEKWSRVMGGILEAAGIKGFGTNEATFRQARNVRGNAWAALVREWWHDKKSNAVSGGEIWALVQALELDGDLGLHDSRVRDARVAFGLALRAQRGRQFRWTGDDRYEVEVRIEAPKGAPVKKPYCLDLVSETMTPPPDIDDSMAANPEADEVPF